MSELYDVIIIGAGPAGMSAALYTSRANLKTLMIEKECPGGKMMKTKTIENYIGGSSTNAIELASNMFAQAIKFGAKYKQGNVVSIETDSLTKKVFLATGEVIESKALILAIGGKIEGNNFKYDKYLNKGLSYCVVCDANFYKGKDVALIGNNESLDDVYYLANIANKVYFLNSENYRSNVSNVETLTNISDYEISGENKVEKIKVNDKTYDIAGVFYDSDANSFNGFENKLNLENGFVVVDASLHTNIEGVFACGDIINRNIKQVISAAGDGALAGLEAIKFVNKNK